MRVDSFDQGNPAPMLEEVRRESNFSIRRTVIESSMTLASGRTANEVLPDPIYATPENTFVQITEILLDHPTPGETVDVYIHPPGIGASADHIRIRGYDPEEKGPLQLRTALNPRWQISVAGTSGAAEIGYHISGSPLS